MAGTPRRPSSSANLGRDSPAQADSVNDRAETSAAPAAGRVTKGSDTGGFFELMLEGYCCWQAIVHGGEPQDWLVLEVNPAFERLTGLTNAVGQRLGALLPALRHENSPLLRALGRILATGEPERLELHLAAQDTWYSVSAFRPAEDCVAALFEAINDRKRAEQALLESSARYATVINTSTDAMFINRDNRVVLVNPACLRLFGAEHEDQLLGKAPFELIHADCHDNVGARIRRMLQHWEAAPPAEQKIVRLDGSVVDVEVAAAPFLDLGRKAIHVMMRDISERKRVEEQLQHQQAMLRDAGALAHVGGWEFDPSTGKGSWTEETARIHDLDPAQAPSTELGLSFYDGESRIRIEAALAAAVALGTPYDLELAMISAKGVRKRVRTICHPEVAGGRVVRMRGAIQDISARVAAEEALSAERSRLRTVLDTIPDLVWLKDPAGAFLSCNRAFERLLGASEGALLGRTDYDFVGRELADSFRLHDLHAIEVGGPAINEEWVTFADDGARVLLETIKTPVYDRAGVLLGVVGIARNVTETRATAEALRQSEERLRLFIEYAPVALAMFDRDMRYISVSRRWCTDFGLDHPALLGRSHYQVFPEISEEWRAIHRRALGGEVVRADEDHFERADGSSLWLRWEVRPWRDITGAVAGIVVFSEDISERKRAEATIQRFISGSPAVIYALRVEPDRLAPIWHGGNLERMTGWSEVDADAPSWWLDNIHPDDRERVQGGSALPYEIDHQVTEFRFRRHDGSYFWVRDEKRLLRDKSGHPQEIVGSWTDVTERVQLEEQLRVTQKLEAIGRLAGGIAHDFNNILTVINGNGELLSRTLQPASPEAAVLGEIREAAERAAGLTQQLLAFSRSQVLAPRVIALEQVVRRVETMLRRLIGEDITLVCELSAEPVHALVDASQLEQVVINLAVNARDAMPRGGQLVLLADAVGFDEESCRRHPGLVPGHYARLIVRDNGCGMSPAVRERIFEPFFTTKPQGLGTGLGLATVFGILKQSGGHIEVESEEGAGSTFSIFLPRVEAPPRRAEEPAQSTPDTKRGRETVLLVEDEPGVRRIARIALESRGYLVLVAANGREAMALAEEHREAIDIVVTDLVMPGMSGRELAEELRTRWPRLAILLMSGYVEDDIVRHGVVEAEVAFLHKPFSLAELAAKVRSVLDAPTIT